LTYITCIALKSVHLYPLPRWTIFAPQFITPINLCESTNSSIPKGNTIKKSEPISDHQTNSIDVQSDVASEEASGDGSDDPVVPTKTNQNSVPSRQQMLDLLIGKQATSSRYFNQKYVRMLASSY
jgi:hypothetical protein